MPKIIREATFVDSEEIGHTFNESYFSVTFEGRILLLNKGYVNDYEMEKRRKKTQNLKDWLLIVGSYLAGIGTVVLALVEIWKILNPSCY